MLLVGLPAMSVVGIVLQPEVEDGGGVEDGGTWRVGCSIAAWGGVEDGVGWRMGAPGRVGCSIAAWGGVEDGGTWRVGCIPSWAQNGKGIHSERLCECPLSMACTLTEK